MHQLICIIYWADPTLTRISFIVIIISYSSWFGSALMHSLHR